MENQDLNKTLSEKIDGFFVDNGKKEESSEVVTTKEVVQTQNPLLEEMEEEEAKQESNDIDGEDEKPLKEEEEVEKDFDSEEKQLSRKLAGYPKEFKEVVQSVKDEQIKTKILEAGKVLRAREDRLSLELGNLKKEHNTTKEFMQFIGRDPVAALKHIARVTNVDLSSLADKPVQVKEDEYDYRTPEEIARDKKLEDIEQKLYQREQLEIQRQNAETARMIDDFKNAVDEDGNLKYPHFEKVKKNMAPFFDERSILFDPNITMAKAYQKAILLDDELVLEREKEILRKAEERKKQEIEKAKKLKKFSGGTSANIKSASSRDAMSEIWDRWAAGN